MGLEFESPADHHWAHIRTLRCIGNSIRSNQKALLTITVRSAFFNFSEFNESFLIFPISPQYREHDVSYDFVSAHLRNGLSFEEAVRLASEKRKADDFNETCRSFGVDSTTMKRRMTKGSGFQEALFLRVIWVSRYI